MCVMVVSELGQQNSSKFLVYTESTRSNDFPSQDEASHTVEHYLHLHTSREYRGRSGNAPLLGMNCM